MLLTTVFQIQRSDEWTVSKPFTFFAPWCPWSWLKMWRLTSNHLVVLLILRTAQEKAAAGLTDWSREVLRWSFLLPVRLGAIYAEGCWKNCIFYKDLGSNASFKNGSDHQFASIFWRMAFSLLLPPVPNPYCRTGCVRKLVKYDWGAKRTSNFSFERSPFVTFTRSPRNILQKSFGRQ